MVSNEEYEKIIREDTRIDWHGVDVPEKLITNVVKFASDGLLREIHKLDGTLSDLSGTALDKRKKYIKTLKSNLQNMPYSLNGDFYLKKKTNIEHKIEEEKKDKLVKRKKTTKSRRKTSKSTVTKNKK